MMKKIRLTLLILMAGLLIGCANYMKDGLELLQAGNYEEAIVSFQKEIAEEKNLDEAYRGVGIAYFELEDYSAAAEAFENALANGAEETASIYQMLGVSYLQLDEYEKTLENYEKALRMEDCTEEMRQEILFNEIAIYQIKSDWDTLKEKVSAYVAAYPDDERMDKTAEFLETR